MVIDEQANAGWYILRTSGGQTLPLASSLSAAGHDAWTPARILRSHRPAKTETGTRLIESTVPILPSFVFIRAVSLESNRQAQLLALAILGRQSPSPHPRFSIFQHGGRAPRIANREILGLQEEEAREAALIAALHEAESRAEARRIRAEAIRSASARRRAEQALEREERASRRAQSPAIPQGTDVQVIGEPAWAGAIGVLEAVEGHYAHVRFGVCKLKIEGWQVMPAASQALRSAAA